MAQLGPQIELAKVGLPAASAGSCSEQGFCAWRPGKLHTRSLVAACPPLYPARTNLLALVWPSCLCLYGLACELSMPLALSEFLSTPPAIWSQDPLDFLSLAIHPSPPYEARGPATALAPDHWSLPAAGLAPPLSVRFLEQWPGAGLPFATAVPVLPLTP